MIIQDRVKIKGRCSHYVRLVHLNRQGWREMRIFVYGQDDWFPAKLRQIFGHCVHSYGAIAIGQGKQIGNYEYLFSLSFDSLYCLLILSSFQIHYYLRNAPS
ncbi:hypothetical protein ES708_18341 [subsurface metagenome]